MRDFIGNEIRGGDYIVYPGGGNAKCEYGLILMRVTDVVKGAVKAERLRVSYNGKHAEARMTKVTLKSPTKLVRVEPRRGVRNVFNHFDRHDELVGQWVHGNKPVDWDKLSRAGKI